MEEPLFAVAGAAGGQHQAASTTTVSAVLSDLLPNPAPKNPAIESLGFTDFGFPAPLDLERLVLNRGVDTIVVRPDLAMPDLAEVLTRLRFQGVRITTLPDLCSQILEKLPLETLSDTWFSFATGFNLLHARIFRKVKRLLDILLASAGLILTLPISLLVAIVLKVESPGPVLFRQWRVGWREKPFLLLKFRSMRLDAESDGKAQWATPQDPRVTFVGRILRRLHIDEIPQMINVLLGEMSFIGPRPERPVFVGQLKGLVPFYYLRHYIPPGITGWAQVNYPYGDCVDDAKKKLQYDLFYVRYASITLDLRILLRTVRAVLFRTGSR
jgi:exopolysaccharide biosynthesis polyprenyl glycosylphosphotransferase